MIADHIIIEQLKKGQGETNRRLDALLKAQQDTNAWLARVAELLEAQLQQQHAAQPPSRPQPVVYGSAPSYPPPSGRR